MMDNIFSTATLQAQQAEVQGKLNIAERDNAQMKISLGESDRRCQGLVQELGELRTRYQAECAAKEDVVQKFQRSESSVRELEKSLEDKQAQIQEQALCLARLTDASRRSDES